MSKNVIIGFLSVVAVCLAVLYVRNVLKPDDAGNDIAESSQGAESKVDELNSKVKRLEKMLEIKEQDIARLKTMAEESSGAIVTEGAQQDPTQITSRVVNMKGENPGLQKVLSSLMDSDMASNKGRRAPSKRDIYAPLLKALGLSGQNADDLLELLNDSNFLIPGLVNSNDDKIKELLGEDGFAVYKEYEKELPARLFVDDFATDLAESGLDLSDEQYAAMLKLNPDAVKGVPLSYSPMSITLNGSSGNVDEMVDGAVGKAVDDFSSTLDHAEGILSEEQMKLFDDYLSERLQQKEKAAEFAETILPNVISPEMLKGLGANGEVKSSVTIMNGEDNVLPAQ